MAGNLAVWRVDRSVVASAGWWVVSTVAPWAGLWGDVKAGWKGENSAARLAVCWAAHWVEMKAALMVELLGNSLVGCSAVRMAGSWAGRKARQSAASKAVLSASRSAVTTVESWVSYLVAMMALNWAENWVDQTVEKTADNLEKHSAGWKAHLLAEWTDKHWVESLDMLMAV